MNDLTHHNKWFGSHRELNYSITQVPGRNDGHDAWCFYVTIHERQLVADIFNAIWLPPRIAKLSEEHRGYIMHDYSDCLLANADWHGGITFYKKHGELEGYRAVEGGCDYSHLFDQELGYPYTLESVDAEARQCIDSLITVLAIH